MTKQILITGGAGFIGSHLVQRIVTKYPDYGVINADALTYAGNLANLRSVERAENYTFVRLDIRDAAAVDTLFDRHDFDMIIHLAAESHVDRSIENPTDFILTNVLGTVNLLNAARKQWGEGATDKLFYHVSTDEVYGSLGDTGLFREDTPYDPRSPYSASKASSDHFVRAYHHTYRLPVVISNCSNNYGPYQFPEKLLPLMINNIKNELPLPVYGDGTNVRDWLWVEDHCTAIDQILHGGRVGETYNIGGHNERQNIQIVHALCDILDRKLNRPAGRGRALITYVTDRKGHDRRYAIDSSKLQKEMGWKPTVGVEEGLERTVDWYLANEDWLQNVTSGDYQSYYDQMYGAR